MRKSDQLRSKKRAANRKVTGRAARTQQPDRGARRPKVNAVPGGVYVDNMRPKR